MKTKNITQNKVLMLILPLFFFALFCYGLYSFFWDFQRKNIMNTALDTLAALLSVFFICYFGARANQKKPHAKGKAVLLALLGAVIAAVPMWGIPLLINRLLGESAEKSFAVSIGTSLTLVVFAFVLFRLFWNLSGSFFKVLNRLISIVLAIGLLFTAVRVPYKYLTFHWTYPIYRLFNRSLGGVATSDKSVVYDFALSSEKKFQTENLGTDADCSIKLAKNEREGFQFIVDSSAKDKNVTLSVTDFKNANGNTLPVSVFKECYTSVKSYGNFFSNAYPDALLPLSADTKVELKKNYAQAFYIETVSSMITPAGDYTAVLTLKDDGGSTLLQKNVTASVWKFALPTAPSDITAMGLNAANFLKYNGIDAKDAMGWNVAGENVTDAERQLYIKYYDFLVEHRISPYVIPYDILDSRADAYMSDPRVTSFCIPYPDDDAKLQAYYKKVMSNEVWASKAYFYPIDEPGNEEAYKNYTKITDRLKKLCPGYNMVTPFCTQKVTIGGKELSAIELQKGNSSILCAIEDMYDKEGFLPEMQAAEKSGSALWWYVCCGPQGKYNDFFIRQAGLQHRLLMWGQMKVGAHGLLYWDTTYWDKSDPWKSSKTWDSYDAAGDGCLLYPGGEVGVNGPVGTLRLANITNGLDDYDYLTLANAAFGEKYVNEKIASVVTSLTDYTSDDAKLQSVRDSIGQDLSSNNQR